MPPLPSFGQPGRRDTSVDAVIRGSAPKVRKLMAFMANESLRARRHAWDDVGCFALDYLPGEDRQEKRRAIVRSIKTRDFNAITQGTQLLAALLDERRHIVDDTHDRTAL